MAVNSEINQSNPEIKKETLGRQVLPEVDLSLLQNPNLLNQQSPEAAEVRAEASVVLVDDDAASGVQVSVAASDVLNSLSPEDNSASSVQQAGDGDRIEQEWVDKIKHILASTLDNPYEREERVKDLQAEYILKRYGYEVGKTELIA